MTDVLTKEQRSYNMSRIRGRDTKPEIKLRKALWTAGMHYRLRNSLPGKPDIIFPSAKLAVFVDGCFWHSCPEHATWPESSSKFWREKIVGNMERDKRVNAQLKDIGWNVLRFWEHEIKNSVDAVVRRIRKRLR